jgi:hypothetical protein
VLLDDRCGIVNVHGEQYRSTSQAFNNVPLSEAFKMEDRSFLTVLDDLSTVIW